MRYPRARDFTVNSTSVSNPPPNTGMLFTNSRLKARYPENTSVEPHFENQIDHRQEKAVSQPVGQAELAVGSGHEARSHDHLGFSEKNGFDQLVHFGGG